MEQGGKLHYSNELFSSRKEIYGRSTPSCRALNPLQIVNLCSYLKLMNANNKLPKLKISKAQKRQMQKRLSWGKAKLPCKRRKDRRSSEARREWKNTCLMAGIENILSEISPAARKMISTSIALSKQRVAPWYYTQVMRPRIAAVEKNEPKRAKLRRLIQELPPPVPYSPYLLDSDKVEIVWDAYRLVDEYKPKSQNQKLALADIKAMLCEVTILMDDDNNIQQGWKMYLACAKTHTSIINLPLKVDMREDKDIIHLLRQRPVHSYRG